MLSVMGLIPRPPGKIVSGEAIFGNLDLLKISERELSTIRGAQISMIFQDPMTSLNPVLSIGDQIREPLERHLQMPPEKSKETAVELLKMVGISDGAERLDSFPFQFSGGMRQRVMIAMALACSPKILIADEPTTALDVTIQAQIVELVKKLRETLGMAIIWITHDLGVVAGLAERVNVMYAGYIVEESKVKDIYQSPEHPYTLGLLKSLPRLDMEEKKRLVSIEGVPPVLFKIPKFCPFVSRCTYRVEKCLQENPPLLPVGKDHKAACWVNTRTGEVRQ
jgi:oligopeptide transport system ATP-binding protein